MKTILSVLALGLCGLATHAGARTPDDCPAPFDFNGDGVADLFQVGADPSTAELRSGAAAEVVLYSFTTGSSDVHFSMSAAALLRPGSTLPDLVTGMLAGSDYPSGALACIDLASGNTRWTFPGNTSCVVGPEVITVADQDGDGICEVLSAASKNDGTSAMLVSGRGDLLAIRSGTLSGLAQYVDLGGRLFARQDFDDSGQVDSSDIDTFFGYVASGDLRGDLTGDGLVDGDDFVGMVAAFQEGLTTVVSAAIPPGLQAPQQSQSAPPTDPGGCGCDQEHSTTCGMTLSCGSTTPVRPSQGAMFPVHLKDASGNTLEWPSQPAGNWCAQLLNGPEGSTVSISPFGFARVFSPSEGGVSFRVRFSYKGPNGEDCTVCTECGVTFAYPCPSTCIEIGDCVEVRAINSIGELTALRCLDGSPLRLPLEGGTYLWTVEDEDGTQSVSVPAIWWNGSHAFFETTHQPTIENHRVRVRVRYEDECGPAEAECLFKISGDSDGDGLADVTEEALSENDGARDCLLTTEPDSDFDGFSDALDPFPCDQTLGSDLIADSDNDGIPDFYERQPVVWDPNWTRHPRDPHSGVRLPPPPHSPEGTNPYDADTDHDGAPDTAEIDLGLDPLNPTSNLAEPGVRDGETSVYTSAAIGGLYTEFAERRGWSTTNSDQDHDGVPDGVEFLRGLDPEFPDSRPVGPNIAPDTDGDGISDEAEARLGTNPHLADTDGDGQSDLDELAAGTSPYEWTSLPLEQFSQCGPSIPQSSWTGYPSLTFRTRVIRPLGVPLWKDGVVSSTASISQKVTLPGGSTDYTIWFTEPGRLYTVRWEGAGYFGPDRIFWGTVPGQPASLDLDIGGNQQQDIWGTSLKWYSASDYARCIDEGYGTDSWEWNTYSISPLRYMVSPTSTVHWYDHKYCEPGAQPHIDADATLHYMWRPDGLLTDSDGDGELDTGANGFRIAPDLDIDSRNLFGNFAVSTTADSVENRPTGKLVIVDTSDPDRDGIPNYADWGAHAAEAPMAQLWLGNRSGVLVFRYSCSDPTITNAVISNSLPGTRLTERRFADAVGTCGWRIWTKPLSQSRNPASVTQGGDFVPANVGIPALQLPSTLYLEAVGPSLSIDGDFIRVEDIDTHIGDTVVATSIRIDAHDLRYFDAWGFLDGSLRFRKPMSFASPDNIVQGAVADGASLCMIRMTPAPKGRFPLGLELQNIRGDRIVPEVLGGLRAMREQADLPGIDHFPPIESSYQQDGWTDTVDFRDGVALYVPPATYYDAYRDVHPHTLEGRDAKFAEPAAFGLQCISESTTQRTEQTLIRFGLMFAGRRVGGSPFWVRRPPLVLVHGIKGHGDLIERPEPDRYWGKVAYNEERGSPIPTRIYKVDYSGSNMDGYSENFLKVAEAIQYALRQYHTGSDQSEIPYPLHHESRSLSGVKYAATRVDIVGHSMGGQLIRAYISGISGEIPRGDIRQEGDANIVSISFRRPPFDFYRGARNQYDYLKPENLYVGDVRRFMSLGTLYHGGPCKLFAYGLFNHEYPEASATLQDNLLKYGIGEDEIVESMQHGKFPLCWYDLAYDSLAQRLLEGLAPGDVQWENLPSSDIPPTPRPVWRAANYPTGRLAVPWVAAGGLKAPLESWHQRLVGLGQLFSGALESNWDATTPVATLMTANIAGSGGDLVLPKWARGYVTDVPSGNDLVEAFGGAGLLKGDAVVPLGSALHARQPGVYPPGTVILYGHSHSYGRSGNKDIPILTWNPATYVFAPMEYSNETSELIGRLMSTVPVSQFNLDRTSIESLGK